MKFKKKPVVIEAFQFTRQSFWPIVQWIDNNNGHMIEWNYDPSIDDDTFIVIKTLEGDMKVSLGDWVIQGIKGEFYPCKDDIFRMTYEVYPE